MSTARTLLGLAASVGAFLVARKLLRRDPNFDFRGKVVLLTGGSRGLGLVMARQLAEEGASLAICARDEEELKQAEQDLHAHGTPVLTVACDITRHDEVKQLVRKVIDRFGAIDVLINNAGAIQVGPMETMTLDDYEHAMKLHYFGPLYAILETLPGMKERGEGRIVNISSIGGKLSLPHLLPYSASKFALVGLSEGLRSELAKDSITVTTVCPGLMRTGSPPNADFKGQHRAEYAWFSISDSLPLVTLSAENAARQILDACRRGDAEVVLGVPYQLASAFHGLFPGLTADLLGLVNRLLPGLGGIGADSAKGHDSESWASPSLLTSLTDKAAMRNNQT